MNQREAIGALRRWYTHDVVPLSVLKIIEEEQQKDESPFGCAVRVAHGKYPITPIVPFDHKAVWAVCNRLERQLEIDEPWSKGWECRC